MSKGLEALRSIKDELCCGCEEECCSCPYSIKLLNIEKELKRLTKIDCLFEEIGIDENDLCVWFELQKQDGKKVKALEIVKNKKVNMFGLFETIKYENPSSYNDSIKCPVNYELTQEEYDLLKEVLL